MEWVHAPKWQSSILFALRFNVLSIRAKISGCMSVHSTSSFAKVLKENIHHKPINIFIAYNYFLQLLFFVLKNENWNMIKDI